MTGREEVWAGDSKHGNEKTGELKTSRDQRVEGGGQHDSSELLREPKAEDGCRLGL